MSIETITGEDDLESFNQALGFYLKPCARLNISISLPKLKQPGQSISNRDLMEKIRVAVKPIQLSQMKVTTSTMELVRFETEAPSRRALSKVIKSLDGYSVKVLGFMEPLKVRVGEAKTNFPSRHDWDQFFRNSSGMNQSKPGERPDTIYVRKLPVHWFKEKESDKLPSEEKVRELFGQFGQIRVTDIPLCDPYRKKMSPSISGFRASGFTFNDEAIFESYIQYFEYISFVRAMDGLRNMKLVRRTLDDTIYEAAIQVDFDRSKHLSSQTISKRSAEREKLFKADREKLDEKKSLEKQERLKAEEEDRERKRSRKEEIRHRKRRKEKNLLKRRSKKSVRSGHKKLKKRLRVESKRLLVELCRIHQKRNYSKDASAMSTQKSKAGTMDRTGVIETDVLVANTAKKMEADLRQSLLRDQEKRMRERIHTKMLQRLSAMKNKPKTELESKGSTE